MSIARKSKAAISAESTKAIADFKAKGGRISVVPTGRKVPDSGASMAPSHVATASRGDNKIEYLSDTEARATFNVTAECIRELPENTVINAKGKRVTRTVSHTCTLDFSGLDNKHWMRVAMSNGVIVKVQAILRNHTLAEMHSGIGLAGISLHKFIVRDIIPMERRSSNFGGGRAPVTNVSRITKLIADSRAAGLLVDPKQEKSMLATAAKQDLAADKAKAALQPTSPDTAKPAAAKAAKRSK
jgi:hypothetical protein